MKIYKNNNNVSFKFAALAWPGAEAGRQLLAGPEPCPSGILYPQLEPTSTSLASPLSTPGAELIEEEAILLSFFNELKVV